jgi:outer membrane lipoprotein-sorting protein
MPRERRKGWGKRISTRSSERRMIWGVGWLLLAAVAGSLAIYYARLTSYTTEANKAGPNGSGGVVYTTDSRAPKTGAEAAESYVTKQGGQNVLDGIKSVRVGGTLTVADKAYRFEMTKKAPNLVRFLVENKTGTLMLGVDAEGAWVAYRDAAGVMNVWPADEATRDWLWLQAPMGTWLAHPDTHEANLTLESAGAGNVLPVSVAAASGRKVTYFLEPGELLPHRMELTEAAGGAPYVRAQFEKMQLAANKVWLPYKLDAQGPDGVPVEIEIKQLKFNTGVLNAMFDRPLKDDGETPPAGGAAPTTAVPGTPAGGGGQTAAGAGFDESLKNSFDSNGMRVHNFVAQTNAFQDREVTRIEPGIPPENAPPALAQYGFPWPLPW